MEFYRFACGCQFPIIPSESGTRIEFDLDSETIPLDCPKTWELIGTGRTTGIFQIESQLGKKLSKQLKPENIEQLAALTSIMRPGVLEAKLDGKSLTQHYIDRKNGVEPIEHFHPLLEPILKESFSILIYQEQVLAILKELAGFSLVEADTARRGIGKKKPEVVAKVKSEFLEKAEKLGRITKDEAVQIFDWIEKGQRYLFNKAHAVEYGIDSYLTAYAKCHFPRAFYCSWLSWARAKLHTQEAREELISDAKLAGIEVYPPNLCKKNKFFKIFGNEIYVGLTDVKGVGDSAFTKLMNGIAQAEKSREKSLEKFSWLEFLVYISKYGSTAVMTALLSSGAADFMGVPRTKMLYEYNHFVQLKDSFVGWLEKEQGRFKNLADALKDGHSLGTGKGKPVAVKQTAEKVRGLISSLENPPYKLEDSIEWLAKTESSLFGVSLTCNIVDGRDTASANCVIRDFLNGRGGYCIIGVEITSSNEYTIKKEGKNKGAKMSFIKCADSSASMDAVIFSEAYKMCKPLLFEGNTVLIGGGKGRDKDGGFIIDKVWQI